MTRGTKSFAVIIAAELVALVALGVPPLVAPLLVAGALAVWFVILGGVRS